MSERQQWLLALGVAKQGVSEPDSGKFSPSLVCMAIVFIV